MKFLVIPGGGAGSYAAFSGTVGRLLPHGLRLMTMRDVAPSSVSTAHIFRGAPIDTWLRGVTK